ncbi:MAG: primosomal protein N' (replication factor Y) (superfamily II helicase) [Limisphaerales bacterium]|nr:MAG: primosomal protein N' (replication factor Y) (superfamily II helicase) [Limisphaerales bacterium]KAG0509017.1 MAG: primosomal protein N' (replication factor Y) (superfamily II helicase) [Limisphaerales bacterium]TXT46079.1 MAG: primosomal protein N' (replication factor Y) (superfamily II helicase) [Limisphaerales bacterium]
MVARVTLEIALRKEFDYAIPPELAGQVEVGTRVKVPFGHRQVMGCVTALIEQSTHTNLRHLTGVVGKQSLVTPRVLQLARWIADYYCCAPEIALKSVLPEVVRRERDGWRERLVVRLLPVTGDPPKLTKRQQEILNLLEERRELPLQELLELAETTAETVRRLEDKHLVVITNQVSERDPYAKDVISRTESLTMNAEQAKALAVICKRMDEGGGAGEKVGKRESETASERPLPLSHPPTFPPATFLLHGVTGSGKTEVYLQAIAHALAQRKGAIVLVPEIALTPQTVERFKARFSHGPLQTQVAVLHSHLSAGERHDEWHKIRQGRARIVIGARSAIFAPVEPLGLIIVDEEHEHSYKQEEAPRYHARDVAVVRGQMDNAVVVLGSATPSMESFYNVQRGKYALLELPTRADDKKMPIVRVVDMRQAARKDKGTPIFSEELKEAITKRLERKEQTMLFLNRRGYSSSLQCPQCGFVAECPNCSVALTYHRRAQKICCHICGHEAPAPTACPEPKCRSAAIRYAGLGTERVEETLGKLFPHARIARMDSDLMKRKEDYRRVLGDFKAGKTDILVGTQMIAKGLHFENVTLVGVIHADLSLHIPDFRAGERTFQLLTQVSGRAGRGEVEGEVFVQSFTPFHPAIQYARRHDFTGFYEQEIEFREQLNYPPASRLALLTFKGRNEEKVKLMAEHVTRELESLAGGKVGKRESEPADSDTLELLPLSHPPTFTPAPAPTAPLRDLVLAGPAPAPLLRAETFYRYQLMLRTRQMPRVSKLLAKLLEAIELPEDVTLTVDVDPVSLM